MRLGSVKQPFDLRDPIGHVHMRRLRIACDRLALTYDASCRPVVCLFLRLAYKTRQERPSAHICAYEDCMRSAH